jgi:hypothetical protein
VTPEAGEAPILAFDREPPDTWLHVQRRVAIAHLGAHDPFSDRTRGAVERITSVGSWGDVASRGIGRIRAKLIAKHTGPTARSIACLTGSGGDADPCHEGVVAPAVLMRATIGPDQGSSFAVERIACALKCDVE